MLGVVVGLHAAAVWGLLQMHELRHAVARTVPVAVSLVMLDTPPARAAAPTPPQSALPRRPPPQAVPAPRPAAPTAVALPSAGLSRSPAPTPASTNTTEAAEPSAPVAIAAPSVAAPAVAVAPPSPPKVIPASAVQYLEPIVLEYPRLSKRAGETGRVMIRVFIDEAGLAKSAQVNRSSGHPRLDDAALDAVQKARFKPYTENGQPVAGWVFIPLEFELEK